MTEIDRVHHLAAGQIDHGDLRAISPRPAHARVAVDRHIRRLPVRRSRHLMAGHTIDRHGGDLLARSRIDQAQIVIVLVRHQQQRRCGFCCVVLSIGKNRKPTHHRTTRQHTHNRSLLHRTTSIVAQSHPIPKFSINGGGSVSENPVLRDRKYLTPLAETLHQVLYVQCEMAIEDFELTVMFGIVIRQQLDRTSSRRMHTSPGSRKLWADLQTNFDSHVETIESEHPKSPPVSLDASPGHWRSGWLRQCLQQIASSSPRGNRGRTVKLSTLRDKRTCPAVCSGQGAEPVSTAFQGRLHRTNTCCFECYRVGEIVLRAVRSDSQRGVDLADDSAEYVWCSGNTA